MPAGADLAGLAWPDVAARASTLLLAVPLGSTEQHGLHLPLGTDTDIAVELCRRLASARIDVAVAPALPYGASGEHAHFPGTLSIGQAALQAVVVELVRSADVFAGVVLVSAHGGNAEALARAARLLEAEGRRVLVWSPRAEAPDDTHAGWVETSAMLALRPSAVRLERAEAGPVRPLAELMPVLRSGGVAAVSVNGVLGDPRGAAVGTGEALLQEWADDLVQAVGSWP